MTWTIEHLVHFETAVEPTLSPDGRRVVWVRRRVATVDGTERTVSNLWETRLGAEPRQLTRGEATVSNPRFSPDGDTIGFLSNRPLPGHAEPAPGKVQLWLLPAHGGEAHPATRGRRPVLAFAFRDNGRVVLRMSEAPSLWEREREAERDTSKVVDDPHRTPPIRLYELTLASGEIRPLTANRDWIRHFAVSPDGRYVVATADRSLSYGYDARTPPRTLLLDLTSGEERALFSDDRLLPSKLRWSPDARGFYFFDERSHHPRHRVATVNDLYFHELASGETRRLDADWVPGAADLRVLDDGVLVLRKEGVLNRPVRLRAPDFRPEPVETPHGPWMEVLEAGSGGNILVYEHSTANRLRQWYAVDLSGDEPSPPMRLTDLNRALWALPTGDYERLTLKGANGDPVEGLLRYPLDWNPQVPGPRPLLLHIHGGPASRDEDQWRNTWSSPVILHQQRGAFVLQLNYHGSTGYGLDWVHSIAGRYLQQETADWLAGIDTLLARGWVDGTRMGILGWSNGGIIGAELITRDARFRAAAIGAANVEWLSDWANVDFGATFDEYYLGATPLENPQRYLEISSYLRLDRVSTPTIVFTGTDDRAVPPYQAWNLFRALQQCTDTPTHLVLFPGEGHSLEKIAHQRRKLSEELAWFDRHLYDCRAALPEAVKAGSRLASLAALGAAARDNGAYGERLNGLLVPEIVDFRGLRVGRFPVTRGQYAQFDPAHAPAPGTENLPATGMGGPRALAYARWLARATGRPYRLPSRAEWERLAEDLSDPANTLDHWAGYAANPEDSAAIRAFLAALPVDHSLLTPVDAFPGVGEPMVFDLGGNVAVWVEHHGAPLSLGPSAERPARWRHCGLPAADYQGLRVVLDDSPSR